MVSPAPHRGELSRSGEARTSASIPVLVANRPPSHAGGSQTPSAISFSLLLRDHGRAGWPHARGLDDDLPVLGPDEVGRLRRLGIECACGIDLELAFVPLFADTKIERPGQDNGRAPLIGMPVRHDLDARRQLGSLNVHARFGRVTIQDRVLVPGPTGALKSMSFGSLRTGCVLWAWVANESPVTSATAVQTS